MADTPIPLNNRGFRPSWVTAQKLEGCYDNGILEAKALSLDGLRHYPSAKYQVRFCLFENHPHLLFFKPQTSFPSPLAHICST